MTAVEIPTLDAWVIRGDGSVFHPDVAVLWCEPCRRWHTHGAVPGHRVAHCVGGTAYPVGYFLRLVGRTTTEGIARRRGTPDPATISPLEAVS